MAKSTSQASPRPRSSARLRSQEPPEIRLDESSNGTARGRSRSAKPKKTEKEVGAVAESREPSSGRTVTTRSRSRKADKKSKSPPPKSVTPKATPRKAKTLVKNMEKVEIAKAAAVKKKTNKKDVRKSEPARELPRLLIPAPPPPTPVTRKRAKSFGMRKETDPPVSSDHPAGSKRSLCVTPFETSPESKRQKRKSTVPRKKAPTVSGARMASKNESGVFTRPLPVAAMALTAVGGVLTAWFYLGIKGLPRL